MSEQQIEMLGAAPASPYKGEVYDLVDDVCKLSSIVERVAHCFLEQEWWCAEDLADRVNSLDREGRKQVDSADIELGLREIAEVIGPDVFAVKVGFCNRMLKVERPYIERLARWLAYKL